MKIVCDNCATKYSIADEKVRGKVFKIRCKKCSHIIVVKGTEGAAADAGGDAGDADAGADSGDAAPAGDGWHVVINGEQVGPLSPTEIRAKFSGGEIDAETFAWKEGFGDWQRLASIDEFRDLALTAAPADSTRRTDAADLFGGNASSEPSAPAASPSADLFGGSPDLFAGAPAPTGPNVGLFSQAPTEIAPPRKSATPGFGTPAQAAAPAPAPQVAEAPAPGGKAMTGQRNENSVLFSLNNLQALASGGNQSKPTAAPEPRAGFANSQTEGSGLIDIRAMAAATLSSPSGSSSSSGPGEIPSFASAPVFSPIAAPILLPSAPSGPPKWIYPIIGLGVAAVVAVVVVGVMLLNRKPEQVAMAPVAPTAPVTAPAAAPPATTAAAPTAAAPGSTTPAPAAPTAPTAAAAEKHPAAGAHPAAAKGSKGDKGPAPAKVAKADTAPVAAAPEAPAAKPAPAKKKGGDDLDSLLDGASSSKPAKADREEKASANDDNLPDQLDKGAIVGGMGKVKPKVGSCYEQFKVPGIANVAVTIAKSGKVSSAAVSGAFAGTPTGDCVAKAVKTASFPPFKGASQSINYPFMLK